MGRAGHYLRAEELIRVAFEKYDNDYRLQGVVLAAAQVHATLATVDAHVVVTADAMHDEARA